jgi:hypothetical protein
MSISPLPIGGPIPSPGNSDPAPQTAKQVLATLEGQTLYELYLRTMAEYGMSPLSVAGIDADHAFYLGGTVMPANPVQWKHLSPRRKALWQDIAMKYRDATS